jgi:nucleoside permease NupC
MADIAVFLSSLVITILPNILKVLGWMPNAKINFRTTKSVSTIDILLPGERSKAHSQNILHAYVRSEVFTVVTMKNAVFWDVTPCGSCKN